MSYNITIIILYYAKRQQSSTNIHSTQYITPKADQAELEKAAIAMHCNLRSTDEAPV